MTDAGCKRTDDDPHKRVGGPGAADAGKLRARLPGHLRWLQVCLLVTFTMDVLSFSSSYPFLPKYLADLGHADWQVSVAFGLYGAVGVLALILLLALSSTQLLANMGILGRLMFLIGCTAASAAGCIIITIWPQNYAILLAAKCIKGAGSAGCLVYALILVTMLFPPQYQIRAIAFVEAGLTLGDSIGPIAGGIAYDVLSIRGAYGFQALSMGLATCLLASLLVFRQSLVASDDDNGDDELSDSNQSALMWEPGQEGDGCRRTRTESLEGKPDTRSAAALNIDGVVVHVKAGPQSGPGFAKGGPDSPHSTLRIQLPSRRPVDPATHCSSPGILKHDSAATHPSGEEARRFALHAHFAGESTPPARTFDGLYNSAFHNTTFETDSFRIRASSVDNSGPAPQPTLGGVYGSSFYKTTFMPDSPTHHGCADDTSTSYSAPANIAAGEYSAADHSATSAEACTPRHRVHFGERGQPAQGTAPADAHGRTPSHAPAKRRFSQVHFVEGPDVAPPPPPPPCTHADGPDTAHSTVAAGSDTLASHAHVGKGPRALSQRQDAAVTAQQVDEAPISAQLLQDDSPPVSTSFSVELAKLAARHVAVQDPRTSSSLVVVGASNIAGTTFGHDMSNAPCTSIVHPSSTSGMMRLHNAPRSVTRISFAGSIKSRRVTAESCASNRTSGAGNSAQSNSFGGSRSQRLSFASGRVRAGPSARHSLSGPSKRPSSDGVSHAHKPVAAAYSARSSAPGILSRHAAAHSASARIILTGSESKHTMLSALASVDSPVGNGQRLSYTSLPWPETPTIDDVDAIDPHADTPTLWSMLLNCRVLGHCILICACQVARTALDILIPMSLPTIPALSLGLCSLGSAVGSVSAPFVLDWGIARANHKVDTYKVLAVSTLVQGIASCAVLFVYHASGGWLPLFCGALVMLFSGAAQSSSETLIYSHLTHDTAIILQESDFESDDLMMTLFSLFWVLGFAVGAFLPAAVQSDVLWQQQVASIAMGVMLLACSCYSFMSKPLVPHKPAAAVVATPCRRSLCSMNTMRSRVD